MDFQGRVVAVTGAGVGFGRSIARSFAEHGAQVFATDIKQVDIDATASQPGIIPHALDLTDRAAGAAWIASVEQRAGRPIDVLVNNAGGMLGQHHKPVEEVDDASWDSIFAVNLNAAFTLIRAAVPGMKRMRSGRIINISSGAAFRPSLTRIQAYCSSKHAVLGLTRQLAMELGPFGITVNSVAPGLVLTDSDKQADWDALGPERQKASLAGVALGRLGEPQDIADAVLFFASDMAGFISGQILPVNGGRL
ncbi:MAG TPA: SDR family NAD(P)-dependent oxidoreductase [Roseomonas sp.]|jgi:3-oxoacyl-[acyl-carrier protein] reductase